MHGCTIAAALLFELWYPVRADASVSGIRPLSDPCPSDASAAGPAPDHAIFNAFLQDVVFDGTKEGVTSTIVDYEKIRKSKPLTSQLGKYILSLCSVNVKALSTNGQLTFCANAYNALMISIVLHYKPSKSVTQLHVEVSSGSIWKEVLGTVAGEKVSLGIIEHKKIRGDLAKAGGVAGRMHSALNCASLSCPDIQKEAFEESTLVSHENLRKLMKIDKIQ